VTGDAPMRVAVVGIGGTGSAALRFLAKAGHDAVGFEQFRSGHDRGSSHGETRIIRYLYPDPFYTRLMGEAYPLWAALEEAAGEELLVRCGGLLFGPEGHARISETEAALVANGLPYQRLEPRAVGDRFPAIQLQPGEAALYQPDTGFLRASRCVRANVRLAVEHGARLREDAPVRRVEPRGEEVVVETDADTEAFDRVILSAGAWISRFAAGLDLPLRVSRQQVVYLKIARNADWFAPGRFPVWIDATERHYGLPSDGVIDGVKMAAHHLGETVDPDHVRREVDASYLEEMAAFGTRRFPDLAPVITHAHTCLYTNAPNEDFILDRLPQSPNVWLVSGCSGHGFKFTVLLGKIAADLAAGKGYPRDLSRFALSRVVDV